MAKKKARKKVGKKKTSRKSKSSGRKKAPTELIISKSRTKGASSLNVSGDFYVALDGAVREMIARAEGRAEMNNRRTLRPQDL